MLRAFVTLAVVLSLDAFAAEDEASCSLSRKQVSSQFDATKLPKGATLKGGAAAGRTYQEVLRFADGLEVKVQVGGCQHLSVTVEVRSKTQVTSTLTPTEAVAVVTKVLGRLPLKKHTLLQPLLDGVAKVKVAPASFPVVLECQAPFVCEVTFLEDGPMLMVWLQVAL